MSTAAPRLRQHRGSRAGRLARTRAAGAEVGGVPREHPVEEHQRPGAWFCVDADALRSGARMRNASDLHRPELGRVPLAVEQDEARVQPTYAFSVRRL